MKSLFAFLLLFSLLSCVHTPEEKTRLTDTEEAELYQTLKKFILEEEAKDLKECHCMKAFYRDLKTPPNNTVRYVYDRKLGEQAIMRSQGRSNVKIFAIGSGLLLNELTAFSYVLALGKNLEIYANDHAYIFYGQDNFEEKATQWAENKELIPEGWKGFYFGIVTQLKKDSEPLIPFLHKHHRAVDQFKNVIQKIARHYKRTVNFKIILPPTDAKIKLPEIDLVTAIDAFQDLPNLMYNFFYNFSFARSSVRFIGLNKTKPLGDFWDGEKDEEREHASLQTVHIDVYDITQESGFGSYRLVEKLDFSYTKDQKEKSVNYIKNPEAKNGTGLYD